MSVRVFVELPEEAFSALRTTPEDFVREMRLAAAVKWYELGRLSQSKAAEVVGVTRHELLEALSRFKVSPVQISPEQPTKSASLSGQRLRHLQADDTPPVPARQGVAALGRRLGERRRTLTRQVGYDIESRQMQVRSWTAMSLFDRG
jgi:predicted HTH domain antitoxin